MATISFDRIFKSFDRDQAPWAVEDFSLQIDDGELVVFVGPSGCGKSTTLRMLAGLEQATSGQIRIGGKDVTRLPPKDRDVAMVFQNYALYPQKSVYENMAFGLRVRGESDSSIDLRVREAARSLDLTSLLERKPRQLSGGQMQRVALGRALVRDPAVFLLDEPLSNLDAKLRVRTREEIASIHQKLGATMIYVTHDQVEAMTLGDRIVIMKDGVMQQVGRPLDLYDRPRNTFVATFIGSPEMNLFQAELVNHHGEMFVRAGDLEVPLPSGQFTDVNRQITLGIRPEHILRARGSSAANLHVRIVEQVGAQTYVIGTLFGQRVRAVFDRDDKLQAEAVVPVELPELRLHVFSRETGMSMRLATPPN